MANLSQNIIKKKIGFSFLAVVSECPPCLTIKSYDKLQYHFLLFLVGWIFGECVFYMDR